MTKAWSVPPSISDSSRESPKPGPQQHRTIVHEVPKPKAHKVNSLLIEDVIDALRRSNDASPLLRAFVKVTVLPWLLYVEDLTLLMREDILLLQDMDGSLLCVLEQYLRKRHLSLSSSRDPSQWISIRSAPVPVSKVPGITLDRLVPQLNRYLRAKPTFVGDALLLSVGHKDIKDLFMLNIKTVSDLNNKRSQMLLCQTYSNGEKRAYWSGYTMDVGDRLTTIVEAFLALVIESGLNPSNLPQT
jgi:hypothetical protein